MAKTILKKNKASESHSPVEGLDVEESSQSKTLVYHDVPTSNTQSKKRISKLKSLRKSRGLTLEELSELTGISPSYLSRLEAGARRLNTDLIHRLANVFKCPAADLLESEPWVKSYPPSCIAVHSSDTQAADRDLPIYKLVPEEDANPISLAVQSPRVDFNKPIDWAHRPVQLSKVHSAFGLYMDKSCLPRYSPGDILLVHPSKPLSVSCSVVAVKHDDSVAIGQFEAWTNEHLEMISYQRNTEKKVVNLPKDSLKAVYRIIGCFENL